MKNPTLVFLLLMLYFSIAISPCEAAELNPTNLKWKIRVGSVHKIWGWPNIPAVVDEYVDRLGA